MSKGWKWLCSMLISGLLACAVSTAAQSSRSAAAETSAQAPLFHVTSRLVVLDVVVTDQAGRPVSGLEQNDFTVYEDNQPQTIFSFESPAQHQLPADVQINATSDLARAPQAPVTMVVLDELNTSFQDMSYARRELNLYLEKQPALLAEPTTLLAATNNQFEVLQDYTRDRDKVIAALNKHFPEYSWRLDQSGKSGSGAVERLAMSLGSLQQIAQAMTGHPGRKNLIWVGAGFPSVDLSASTEMTDQQRETIESAVQKLIDRLQDARVTVTTIDPTINSTSEVDIESPNDLDTAEDASGSDPFQSDVNFQLLAPATGGRSYVSRNDIDAEIDTAEREGDTYYTISYVPSSQSEAKQPYRRIRVTVDRPGLLVSTRNGYYTQPPQPPAQSASQAEKSLRTELSFEMGHAVNSNMQYIGLPVTVSPVPGQPGTFIVHVDSHLLTWHDLENGVSRAEITLLVASFGRTNKMLTHQTREMSASMRSAQIGQSQATADFVVAAAIPSEAVRLRFVVRDATSGKLGTADYSVKEKR